MRSRPRSLRARSAIAVIIGIVFAAVTGCSTANDVVSSGRHGQACLPDKTCNLGLRCVKDTCINDTTAASGPADNPFATQVGNDGFCAEGTARPCYSAPFETEGIGTCEAGVQVCVEGVWDACLGEDPPRPETCDGLDNDCNGQVDDACSQGTPVGNECIEDADCDDGEPCTVDDCESGHCHHPALTGLACGDGDLCTFDDRCTAEGTCAGTSIVCQEAASHCVPQRECNGTSSCTETFAPVDAPCDDNNTCTENDACDGAGRCGGDVISGWQRVAGIDYTESLPDGHWAAEQVTTWTVNRPLRQIRVTGHADEGGYCYASWSTGHAAVYRHHLGGGLHNIEDGWHAVCPDFPPVFDGDGKARLCQASSSPGEMLFGQGVATGLELAPGTVVTIKARHTKGVGGDHVRCYMDVRCDDAP